MNSTDHCDVRPGDVPGDNSRDDSSDRRYRLSRRGGVKLAASAAASAWANASIGDAMGDQPAASATSRLPGFGSVRHVVHLWLGGGMGQVDTFDPKRIGDPKNRKPGSLYSSIATEVDGVTVCEHLPSLAARMGRITAIRSMTHDVIDEHAAATNFMHTGRAVNATAAYPSIGSIVASRADDIDPSVPPYALIGYPNQSRGAGFLGAAAAPVYATDLRRGPVGLSPPPTVDSERRQRREALLRRVRQNGSSPNETADAMDRYDAAIDRVLAVARGGFARAFEVDREPDAVLNRYDGKFARRLLATRRMIQRDVRFIEVGHNLNFVNGTGWDVHNEGIQKQHELIADLDRSVAALMDDLDTHRLLDQTLIIISSEFGRPSAFDGRGGRGHQGAAFTTVLCGGVLKHTGSYGATDDESKRVIERPVSVPDMFATVFAAVGIDPALMLYDGDRPVPVTDGGTPIATLLG